MVVGALNHAEGGHAIADWEYQSRLWPRDVTLYASLDGGRPRWVVQYALPISKRIGRGMDFMWQREPFRIGMAESKHRPGADPPGQLEVLTSGAGGLMRLREGPAVDYLLAYYSGSSRNAEHCSVGAVR